MRTGAALNCGGDVISVMSRTCAARICVSQGNLQHILPNAAPRFIRHTLTGTREVEPIKLFTSRFLKSEGSCNGNIHSLSAFAS